MHRIARSHAQPARALEAQRELVRAPHVIDGRVRVVAGARRQVEADQIGFALLPSTAAIASSEAASAGSARGMDMSLPVVAIAIGSGIEQSSTKASFGTLCAKPSRCELRTSRTRIACR